jgi:hypothetical protein
MIQILKSPTQWTVYSTKNYKYDNPFGNEQTYIFSYGEVDIHPYTLSPDIKTCQESIMTSSTDDETNYVASDTVYDENTMNNRSIVSTNDHLILHANNISPQNNKDEFKVYRHLHCIDMQIQSIPKPPK